MLSGMQGGIHESMFGSLAPQVGPTADELEAERKRIMVQRSVNVKRHSVRIFDMHKAKDIAAYSKLMQVLMLGVQARTHMIWANDRQLVTRKGDQCWLTYLEWTEYALEERVTAPVGVNDTGER